FGLIALLAADDAFAALHPRDGADMTLALIALGAAWAIWRSGTTRAWTIALGLAVAAMTLFAPAVAAGKPLNAASHFAALALIAWLGVALIGRRRAGIYSDDVRACMLQSLLVVLLAAQFAFVPYMSGSSSLLVRVLIVAIPAVAVLSLARNGARLSRDGARLRWLLPAPFFSVVILPPAPGVVLAHPPPA